MEEWSERTKELHTHTHTLTEPGIHKLKIISEKMVVFKVTQVTQKRISQKYKYLN